MLFQSLKINLLEALNAPLIITPNGEQSVVMLRLLAAQSRQSQVLSAAAQINAGKGTERELAPVRYGYRRRPFDGCVVSAAVFKECDP